MKRKSHNIEFSDQEWKRILDHKKQTVFGSVAAFIRQCLKDNAIQTVKKYKEN